MLVCVSLCKPATLILYLFILYMYVHVRVCDFSFDIKYNGFDILRKATLIILVEKKNTKRYF